MSTITYTYLRDHLASVMDEVCAHRAPVIVTRQKSEPVVLLSLEEYEGMQETLHLLRSPRNASRLMQSIARAEAGELVEHDPLG
jgi:antitoxin YefM